METLVFIVFGIFFNLLILIYFMIMVAKIANSLQRIARIMEKLNDREWREKYRRDLQH